MNDRSLPLGQIRLALHGGAVDRIPAGVREHEQALREIAQQGLALLRDGASAVAAVEQVVMTLEDCPFFNAGVGAALNRDGLPELEASIMDGRTRDCGAVTGVSRVRHPVQLARAVMERSPHVMFGGAGAEALARELKLDLVEPEFFVTAEAASRWSRARGQGAVVLEHDDAFATACADGGGHGPAGTADGSPYGTVGAVARDAQGHLAAATSTGGLINKPPGRIGDSPLIAAGTYADDASVAVSATGTGESFVRTCFAYQVHARVTFAAAPLAEACAQALAQVREVGGRGGCIAVDRHGNLALPFNSRGMYRAWTAGDGAVRVAAG